MYDFTSTFRALLKIVICCGMVMNEKLFSCATIRYHLAIRHHDDKHKKKKAATTFLDFHKKLKTVCGTIEDINEWYGYVRELQDLITTYTSIIPSSVQNQLTSATDLIDNTSGGIQKACEILRGEIRDFLLDNLRDYLDDRIGELKPPNGKITPFLKLALAVGGTAGVIAVAVFLFMSPTTPFMQSTTPDFQLFSDLPSVSVASGTPARSTISVVAKGEYKQPVSLSCSGLPSSIKCSISPSLIIPGQAATVTIVTNDPNLSDKFTGIIIGTAGGVTHSIDLGVDVQGSNAVTTSEYVISLSSKSTDGQSNIGSIIIDSNLHVLPSSVHFTKNSQYSVSVNPPPGYAFDHYDLNHISLITTGNPPSSGLVSATGDGSIMAWFTKQPIFDMSLPTPSISALIGETPKIEIDLTSKNGFSGNVDLQISDAGGLGISNPIFNPNPVSLQKDRTTSSLLTFKIVSDPPNQKHYVTIKASSGIVSKTTTIEITVRSPPVQPAKPLDVTGVPDRVPNQNGWYNRPVIISWEGHDSDGNPASYCDPQVTYSGPDGENKFVTGNCYNKDGKATSGSFTLKYDSTLPTIDAVLDPLPNKNGWNNKPVNIIFNCSDETSDVESCGPNALISQETAGQVVNGMAKDYAGNVNPKSVTVKLDMTPPTFPDLSAYDSSNNQLKDAQSTFSNTVTFYFSSTDNFGPIYYECKLDENSWSLCSSPYSKTLNNNQTGSHTFQVISYDAADNSYGKVATFTWIYRIVTTHIG